MKVLIINGSPRKGGNTAIAVAEIAKILEQEQIEVINYQIGVKDIRGCTADSTANAYLTTRLENLLQSLSR